MSVAIYKRRVEFAETDSAGIVHFSMLFRYMEEAEHAVWRSAGLKIYQPNEAISWPRISAQFDFKAPLRFEDEFDVRSELAAVTRSTLKWSHTIMRGDTVIGSGSVTAVCVTKQPDGSIKSTDIPADILSALRAALS